LPTVPLSLMMPPTCSIFKTDEDTKAVQIDDRDPAKTIQIKANLDRK
jgi:hypothetical protein